MLSEGGANVYIAVEGDSVSIACNVTVKQRHRQMEGKTCCRGTESLPSLGVF